MDKELFELCRETYEKTGWKDTLETIVQNPGPQREIVNTEGYRDVYGLNYGFDAPLYTSDYLLNKLPISKKKWNGYPSQAIIGLQLIKKSKGSKLLKMDHWEASYWKTRTYAIADTPLKALLKLTIALHDAGELPHDHK
jgi:hypothetical protein